MKRTSAIISVFTIVILFVIAYFVITIFFWRWLTWDEAAEWHMRRNQIGLRFKIILSPLSSDARTGKVPTDETVAAAISEYLNHPLASQLQIPSIIWVNTSLEAWTIRDPDSTAICVGAWIRDDPPEFLGITVYGYLELLDHEPPGKFIHAHVPVLKR